MKKLIIEARVNEYASREVNPNVPWTADELGREASAVEKAGASILHFHARRADGSPSHEYGDYAAAIAAIRRSSDLIVHPTLGQITIDGDDDRVAHIVRLAEDPAFRPELASIDIGSSNIDVYNPDEKRFETDTKAYVNRTRTLVHFAQTFRDAGVRPAVACWTVPFLRYAQAFLDGGLVSDPLYLLLVHTGSTILGGHPPTEAGLRAFLAFLPTGHRIEWTINAKPGNLLPLAEIAIREGGHVAIGIGDDPYDHLGSPTNADLVERVAGMAREHGREVATPDEARAMLGLT